MNQQEILEKIEEIKKELEKDKFNIIKEKISERTFHLHNSHRNIINQKLIQRMRKRLILEIELILNPILENQKNINLRLLSEIEQLKKAISLHEPNKAKEKDETKSQKSPEKNKQ